MKLVGSFVYYIIYAYITYMRMMVVDDDYVMGFANVGCGQRQTGSVFSRSVQRVSRTIDKHKHTGG